LVAVLGKVEWAEHASVINEPEGAEESWSLAIVLGIEGYH
jgi:hypothetical protein